MKYPTPRLLTLSFLLILFSCAPPRQKTFEKYTPRSEFIFEGTILVLRSSTIDAHQVTDLAVVRVDRILKAPDVFMNLKGQNITVKLGEPSKARPSSQRVFFTQSWHFGESIGVVELANLKSAPATDINEDQVTVNRIEQEKSEKEFLDRLSAAELIVRGKVVGESRSEQLAMASEHSPEWHEAELEIQGVLKGGVSDSTIMWYNAPKFKKGDEGIWLLKSYEFAGRRLKYPAIIEPNDFYAITEEERIIQLLKKQ